VEATEVRRRRAAAQLLAGPGGGGGADVVDVVRRLLAVQAQDLRSARLALRARCPGLTASAVDAALTEERSLVVGWLGRGTLHLVAAEDYAWLLALTAPARVTANARRLRQEGVGEDDAERAVAVVERALASEGPLRREQLAARIGAEGIRAEGQATPHLLMLAALRGVAVLGPVAPDGRHAFALARDWLGAGPFGGERDDALAELARRYLAGNGPATIADLAAWIGLPVRDARRGLSAIASSVVELGGGLVDVADRDPAPDAVAPRLLPAFDPYLLGWKDRGFAVPAAHARRVHPGGGMLRAVATADGVAVGTWTAPRDGVRIEPFGPLRPEVAAALDREAADVARFLAS
jgi:hypothetical protein